VNTTFSTSSFSFFYFDRPTLYGAGGSIAQ
jgi:hypothetical protein